MSCPTGNINEARFALFAIERGWWVYTTNNDGDSPADVIIFRKNRPIAIQVKTGNIYPDRDNAYGIPAAWGQKKIPYPEGSFDFLAAWLPDVGDFVFYGFAEIGGRRKLYYCPRTQEKQPGNWEVLEQFANPAIITPQPCC